MKIMVEIWRIIVDRPEIDLKRHQNPADTLDDPMTRKQTSTATKRRK